MINRPRVRSTSASASNPSGSVSSSSRYNRRFRASWVAGADLSGCTRAPSVHERPGKYDRNTAKLALSHHAPTVTKAACAACLRPRRRPASPVAEGFNPTAGSTAQGEFCGSALSSLSNDGVLGYPRHYCTALSPRRPHPQGRRGVCASPRSGRGPGSPDPGG